MSLTVSVGDALSIVDKQLSAMVLNPSDSLSLSDSIGSLSKIPRTAGDFINLSDRLVRSLQLFSLLSNTLTLSDSTSVSTPLRLSLSDSVNFVDTFGQLPPGPTNLPVDPEDVLAYIDGVQTQFIANIVALNLIDVITLDDSSIAILPSQLFVDYIRQYLNDVIGPTNP
jgi:hypothetical protein